MSGNLGQAAIEYITQYGWMVLAVSLVGGTVYTQIPTSCNLQVQGFDEDVQISQTGINQDGELLLSLRKKTLDPVKVKQIRLNGSETVYQNRTFNLEGTQEKAVEVIDVDRAESCQDYSLTVVYDKGPVPSVTQSVDVRLPVEIARVLQPFLEIFGGEVDSIDTNSSIMAADGDACIGRNCATTGNQGQYSEAEYVDRSGDEMTGTLFTNAVEWRCIGESCQVEKGSLPGYVSSQNNTLDGTLNVTQIKPENNLCMGQTC